jgi:hypothetical protein
MEKMRRLAALILPLRRSSVVKEQLKFVLNGDTKLTMVSRLPKSEEAY